VTEYCAVISMHSTVRGDKLLSGHVPWCGIGSGHARLGPLVVSSHSLPGSFETVTDCDPSHTIKSGFQELERRVGVWVCDCFPTHGRFEQFPWDHSWV